MIVELTDYLQKVKEYLRLDPSSEGEIISELETHVEDRFLEMQEAGLSDEEAAEKCIGLLGSAKQVAHQIYEVHEQGTWRQALLAAMPHLFFASLFALRWWNSGWVPVALSLVFGIAVYGWCRGKPTWLFPWLGYALLPVVAAGLCLLYLPEGWAWVTIILYIPLVLWLCCYIAIKSIKRDWLYSALMLLPIPTVVGWFLVMEQEVRFSGFSFERLYDFAPWTALSFLVLAVTVAVFIRLRKRRLKMMVLVTSGLLTITMVSIATGKLGLFAFLILIFLMVSFLLVPAWLEHRIRNSNPPVAT